MSGNIKGKDLSYDKSLPPFLQRLHSQRGGDNDADRHERQIARPTKSREVNEDDGPTVVDDTGEVLTKADVEKLTEQKAADIESNVETKEGGDQTAGSKRNDTGSTVSVGTAKKRKAAKVVGEDDELHAEKKTTVSDATVKAAKNPRKKVKPIKLAFDDE